MLELAEENDIPVVGITETMPTNEDAITWMVKSLQKTAEALDKTNQ